MKRKKGYMLTESIVAIAIILILTTFFITLSMFINSSFKKSTITTLGISQIENIQTIFLASSFEEAGEFTCANFEENISFVYNNFTKEELTNNTFYKFTFNDILEEKENGNITIFICITQNSSNVEFSAKLENSQKVYYETPTPLEKAVIL